MEASTIIWATISELGLVLGTGWNFMISQGAQRFREPCKLRVKWRLVSVLVNNILATKLEKETTT